jgi:rod shape-determining protein MreC
VYRKFLKPVIYLAIFLIPLSIVLLKPRSSIAITVLDKASKPISAVEGFVFEFKKLWYFRDTWDAYIKLRNQTDLLKAKVIKLQEMNLEARRLGAINDYRRGQTFTTVVADVIGRDPSSWNASLILDKGSAHAIKVGMPVITPLGIVGKIFEVGKTTSKAILLSDPNFSVASVVQRTRENGLLTGTLQGICRLQYLTDNADVKVGDKVVTSKLSSAFPEGLLIGTIVDVQASQNSHTVECLVDPSVDLSVLEEVVILKSGVQ